MQENDNEQKVENNDTDYLEQMKVLKENTVSKEAYLKLKEENRKLIQAFADGTQPSGDSSDVKPKSVQELTDEFYKNYKDMSNREFAEGILEMRNRTLEETGKDIFMPSDKNYIPTPDDIQTVDILVKTLQSCLDVAEGSDDIFNRELDRVTIKN